MNFIEFGELLKRIFNVKLYWENAPWLNKPKWNLRYENTNWSFIPRDIELCLDTGHLMLGSSSRAVFYTKLRSILLARGKQIKHIHLSENNFKTDQHKHTKKILTNRRVKRIVRGRTFLWEK